MNKLMITILRVVPYSVRDWFNFKIIGKNNFVKGRLLFELYKIARTQSMMKYSLVALYFVAGEASDFVHHDSVERLPSSKKKSHRESATVDFYVY